MRASDADRERVISRLHTAATEGRIAAEELEQRVSTALKARTYGELDAVLHDLPAPRGRERPARNRPVPVRVGGWAISAVRANPFLLIFMIPAVAVTAAMMLTALIVWAAVMVAGIMFGGGSCARRPPLEPWTYRRDRRLSGGPRRAHARSYWA